MTWLRSEQANGDPGAAPDTIGHDPRFAVISLLGEGAEGRVWLARDQRLEREVAIKVRRGVGDATRPPDPVVAAAAIELPGAVRLYDAYFDPTIGWVEVLELVHGETFGALAARVRAYKAPVRVAVGALVHVADALAKMHRATPPIVHSDVSDRNVVVDERGRGVLIDTGMATPEGDHDHRGLGTPGFRAPPRAAGAPPSWTDDLHSLGCLLMKLDPALPFELRPLAVRCLNPDSDEAKRHRRLRSDGPAPLTCAHVAAALDDWMADRPLAPWVHDRSVRWWVTWQVRRHGALIALVVAMLVAAVITGLTAWQRVALASAGQTAAEASQMLERGEDPQLVLRELEGVEVTSVPLRSIAIEARSRPRPALRSQALFPGAEGPEPLSAEIPLQAVLDLRTRCDDGPPALCSVPDGRLTQIGGEPRVIATDITSWRRGGEGLWLAARPATDGVVRNVVLYAPTPEANPEPVLEMPPGDDGREIVAVSGRTWLVSMSAVRSLPDGRAHHPLPAGIEAMSAVAWGEWLVIGGRDGRIVALDGETLAPRWLVPAGSGPGSNPMGANVLRVSPSGQTLLAFGASAQQGRNGFILLDADTPTSPEVHDLKEFPILAADIADGDESCVILGGTNGRVRWVHRGDFGEPTAWASVPGNIWDVAEHDGSATVAALAEGHQIFVLDGGCGRSASLPGSSGGQFFDVALNASGDRLAASDMLGRVLVWDTTVDAPTSPTTLVDAGANFQALAWHPDGWLVVADAARHTLWSWRPGDPAATPLDVDGEVGNVYTVEIDPTGSRILFGGGTGQPTIGVIAPGPDARRINVTRRLDGIAGEGSVIGYTACGPDGVTVATHLNGRVRWFDATGLPIDEVDLLEKPGAPLCVPARRAVQIATARRGLVWEFPWSKLTPEATRSGGAVDDYATVVGSGFPSWPISGVTAGGYVAWVTWHDDVWLYDAKDQTLVARVPTRGARAWAAEIDPKGRTLYVATHGRGVLRFPLEPGPATASRRP